MKKVILTTLILSVFSSSAQFYTGYYVSAPQVHAFDHFKIKQSHGNTKLDGDLTIHAFIEHKEIWDRTATFVSDDGERERLISTYNHGENVISVHVLKFMWDGNEWEYILLGYIAEDKHRHFIIIEEIFNDDTETELLEFNRFDWVKGHHLTTSALNN